jgi:hypothetical protein
MQTATGDHGRRHDQTVEWKTTPLPLQGRRGPVSLTAALAIKLTNSWAITAYDTHVGSWPQKNCGAYTKWEVEEGMQDVMTMHQRGASRRRTHSNIGQAHRSCGHHHYHDECRRLGCDVKRTRGGGYKHRGGQLAASLRKLALSHPMNWVIFSVLTPGLFIAAQGLISRT